MTKFLATVFLAACIIAAGCSSSLDIESERQALLDTDRAFAAAALEGEMDRVFSFWSDDAVIYPAGMPAVRGKEAIREFVARNRAQPGFSLRAEPRGAVVSQDGTLGFTVGDYEITLEGPDGSILTNRGRYLETWQKDEAGSWKCTVEIHAPLTVSGGPDVRPGQTSR
jgi:ketosteroid isomerase-like protein